MRFERVPRLQREQHGLICAFRVKTLRLSPCQLWPSLLCGVESKVVKKTTQKESPLTSLYLFPTDEHLLTQLNVWAAPLEDVCRRGCLRTCVYTVLRPQRPRWSVHERVCAHLTSICG